MTEDKPIRWAADVHAERHKANAMDLMYFFGRIAVMTMGEDSDIPPDHVRKVVDAVITAFREDKKRARRVLDIGDDFLVGGTFYREFAALKPIEDPDHPWFPAFALRSSPEAALHTAKVWGPGARAAYRQAGDWPDGSRWTGPWQDIDPEEFPNAFTDDKEHSD